MLSRIASRWGRLKRATMPVTVLLRIGLRGHDPRLTYVAPLTSPLTDFKSFSKAPARNKIVVLFFSFFEPFSQFPTSDNVGDTPRRSSRCNCTTQLHVAAYSIGSQRTELNVAIGWLVKLSALRYKYQVRREKEGETPKRARCDNERRFPRKFKRCGDIEDSFVIRYKKDFKMWIPLRRTRLGLFESSQPYE
ncbi:LOW QUALITY PROTEIN: hypothetical protein V1478_009979, partial [Vespula squamosa]